MTTVIRAKPAATALRGLDGRNPMGALAALGVQAAFFGDDNPPNLWWTNDYALHAMTDAGVEEIADRAMARFAESIAGPALSPDKSLKGASALKFQNREDTRKYLSAARDAGEWHAALASALVCEGPLSGKGDSKQTDLYFMAGREQFLDMARKALSQATEEHVVKALASPWDYKDNVKKVGTFKWDASHDAEALSVREGEGKFTNLGAEALALMGLVFRPVFGRARPATSGVKFGRDGRFFEWPLWSHPASPDVTRLLANMDCERPDAALFMERFGVFRVFRSRIRRFGQGYGAFSPARVWR